MDLIHILLSRCAALFRRQTLDEDLDEELRTHIDFAIEENLKRGMSEQEARTAALREFGGVTQTKEQYRTQRGLPFLEVVWRDVRFGLRQLQKNLGFTATVVITLGLGIGVTTAIFTLVYDVMLKPLPFAHADRLVTVEEKVAEWANLYPTLPVSANHFTFWQHHNRSFAAMAVMREYALPFNPVAQGAEGDNSRAQQVGVLEATPGIFAVLETEPQVGRAFTAAEAQPGRERVAVLTNDLWREQFGSDRNILGKSILLNGFPYTVVGVMRASFHMPSTQNIASTTDEHRPVPLGVVIPLAFSKEQLAEEMGDLNYFGLARLKPGVTIAQATEELDALQHTIAANLPANEKATLAVAMKPWQEQLVGSNRAPLLILLAAVAGLLLVGCVNIANLLLARAVGQKQQMAVAAALGASRSEMLRMVMRETVVLATLGGGVGILLASALVPAMQRYLPPALDFRGALHLDWAGAGCAMLLSTLATLLAGAAPAWMVSRTAPQEVLHSESRLASESRGSRRARRALVSVEVAVSVALVLLTGLLTASLMKLMNVDRGFTVEHTLTATVDLPRQQYPDRQHRAEFYRNVLGQLDRLPGVEHAAITSSLPLSGNSWGDMVRVPGDNRSWTQLPLESFRWVSSEYFSTIHLRLVAGQVFGPSDWGRNVAVITEKTAKTLWPGRNPIGRQFAFAGRDNEKPFTVVAEVGDARTVSLTKPDPMLIYVPYWYRCDDSAGLVIRTGQDPAVMADAIRKTIWSVDRGVPVPTVRALGGLVTDSVANRRFEMELLLLFAASALLLAGLGVYGVVTYSVVQRHREIGLRLALGAQRGNLYRLVLREGLLPVAIGAIAGIVIAFASARLLGSLLFGISPYDPLLSIGAVCILLGTGTAACLLPARRAASVDPMQALRSE
jgi:predicted permease